MPDLEKRSELSSENPTFYDPFRSYVPITFRSVCETGITAERRTPRRRGDRQRGSQLAGPGARGCRYRRIRPSVRQRCPLVGEVSLATTRTENSATAAVRITTKSNAI